MTRDKLASSSRSKTSEVRVGDTVVGSTEWSLDLSRDYVDVTSFGDMDGVYIPTRSEITGSFSGVMDAGFPMPPADENIPIVLYTEKDITRAHRWILALLRRPRPLHRFAVGQMTDATIFSRDGYTKADFKARSMTVHPDPGTLPHLIAVSLATVLRRRRDELAYRLWDRFRRPVIVIDQDEWQADAYEAYEEEQHYAAMERQELADAYGED